VKCSGTAPAPEINVKRGAASIPDGNTDNLGNQAVGTVNLTYTIDNTAGTAQLDVNGCHGFQLCQQQWVLRGCGYAPAP